MFLFIILFTIGFLIFIELYVGSIMFRYNSDNILSFNLWSGLNFLIHPLYSSFLWNKEGLHINYPFIVSCLVIIMIIYKKFDFIRYHYLRISNGILKRGTTNTTRTNT